MIRRARWLAIAQQILVALALTNCASAAMKARSNAAPSDIKGGAALANATECSILRPGNTLTANNSIMSCDNRFRLILQGDGNLVLYEGNVARWASGTNNGTLLSMQGDGNLVLYSAANAAVWYTATNIGNSVFAVQGDGNLVVYAPGNVPQWYSKRPNLTCASGVCNCSGLDISGTNPMSDAINACVAGTPNGWTMELDAGVYKVDKQILLNHAITLTTKGSRTSTTACFNGLNYNGNPCATLLAADNSVFKWGGILFAAKVTQDNGLAPPAMAPLSNVSVDHIIIHGNMDRRVAANTISGDAIPLQWNFTYFMCSNCSFLYGASRSSLRGNSAQNSPGFRLIFNTIDTHGSAYEQPQPRNAACFVLAGVSPGSNIAYNYLYNCTDMGLGFDTVDMTDLNVEGNQIISRSRQYMTSGIHINSVGFAFGDYTRARVHKNYIDCRDPKFPKDSQCTDGIIIGGNPWAANLHGTLYSGLGNDVLEVKNNTIIGSSIGINIQFFGVSGNAVIVHPNDANDPGRNIIDVTHDNPPTGFFLPWTCKLWQGRHTGANDICCNEVPGKRWYDLPFPGVGSTARVEGAAPRSTEILLAPDDGPYVWANPSGTLLRPGQYFAAFYRGYGGSGTSCP